MGTRGAGIAVIRVRSYNSLFKRAFYPHAREVLIRETLLDLLRLLAIQGQQGAFQVESKTNPIKEMTFLRQPLFPWTAQTIHHHCSKSNTCQT